MALGLLVSFPLCFTPAANPDVPWHLSAGRWMAEHGGVPRADFLSWTKPGETWIDFEWGTQRLYYALYSAGGWTALWVLKAAIFAAILAAFAALVLLWRLPPWAGLGALPLTLALIPNLDVRPENLTLLFCLLQLYILEWYRLNRHRSPSTVHLAVLQFVLYAVWANMHGGFVMGLLLGGLYILGEAFSKRNVTSWVVIGLASFAGTLANPFGVKVYEVTISHARDLATIAKHIEEWQETSIRHISMLPYWVLLVFTFSAFAWHFAKTKATPYAHLLTLAVFGILSARYSRNTAFFCLFAYPLSLLALSELESPPLWARWRKVVLAVAFPVVAVLSFLYMHPPGTFQVIHDEMHEPTAAAEYLAKEKAALSGLNLFNPWEWGGYVGWRLHPDYKVFMDGRYLFHHSLPKYSAALADPPTWNDYLDREKVDLVLFHNWRQWAPDPEDKSAEPLMRPIARWFFPKERWALVYWDSKAVILVRRDKAPKQWLKEHEYTVLFPKDQVWLRRQVLAKKVGLPAIEREARRYLTEVGDRENGAKLVDWLEAIKKEVR